MLRGNMQLWLGGMFHILKVFDSYCFDDYVDKEGLEQPSTTGSSDALVDMFDLAITIKHPNCMELKVWNWKFWVSESDALY